MLKSITNTVAAICTAMATGCLLAAPASADFMKAINVSPASNAVGGPVIEVQSDGEKWTQIKPDSHELKMNVDIRAGSGWRIVTAYIGVPSADFGGTSHSTDAVRRLGGGKDTKSITRPETHTFHTNDLVIDTLSIINLCNSGGNPATEEHTEFTTVGVGIKAYFQTRGEANDIHEAGDDEGRSETAYTRAPVTIRCLAAPSRVAAPPKPVSVDIRVKARGDTCPKDTDITAYIDYDVPMTARFRVIHNGVEPKSAPIEIKARKVTFAGKIWYRVERLERHKLDPGKHTFQIKVLGGGQNDFKLSPKKTITVDCPPFKVSSAWLSYQVENKPTCNKKVSEEATFYANRPGDIPYRIRTQGGLAVTQGIAYALREGDKYVARRKRTLTMGAFDQMMVLEVLNDPSVGDQKPLKVECLKLTGDFSFIDNGSPKCPRQGKALINFSMNMQTNVHWSLDCTNDKHLSGVAQAVKGPNGYIAPALASFKITKTSVYSCALKTVAPKAKTHQWKSHTFKCVTRAVETGSNDIQVAPRPNSDNTRVPATLVPNAQDKAKADAAKRRHEAAKKKVQADAKRKREAASKRVAEAKKKAKAEARRKRAEAAKKVAEAKRKREAAAKRRKAAEAAAKRRKAAEAAQTRRRAAAAALARRKTVVAGKRRTRR